jgi:dTMP kinase
LQQKVQIGDKYMIKLEFEGTDSAGKTTGMKYFAEQAKLRGLNVVETREVGNPHIPSCVKMREFVLDPNNKLDGRTMELIFSAMRIESDIWLKNLAKSKNPPDLVISDRGFYSHLAYGLHNTSEDFVTGLFEDLMAKQTSLPDVVIYFNVNTEVARQRMSKRGTTDVIEQKGIKYQESVRNAFKYYLERSDVLYFEVDANQDIFGVQTQLDKILSTFNL